MHKIIEEFFQVYLDEKKIEIYNEFSLQHELGCFLRNHPKFENEKIQFERNVSYEDFNFQKKDFEKFEKKEIDISIFNRDKHVLSTVIELKFPKNGQYPESMFSFCKDIVFLEQLVKVGFNRGYFIAVADDHLFYEGGKSTKPIYQFFRTIDIEGPKIPITGKIEKPTGKKNHTLHIKGSYTAKWNQIKRREGLKYCIIEIKKEGF